VAIKQCAQLGQFVDRAVVEVLAGNILFCLSSC